MEKRFFILLCVIMFSIWTNAQELRVGNLESVTRDLTARTQPRIDADGNKCALIKVQLPINNVKFKGSLVGDVQYKINEYWVYMSKGATMLVVNAPSYNELTIAFNDWNCECIESETTYNLVINIQSLEENQPKTEENGHSVVDLGLSVGWATCNVGATTPENKGEYYAWGETSVKKSYSWKNYRYCKGSPNLIFKYNKKDKKTTLDMEDDVANAKWGGKWRMPTPEEFKELKDNCIWEEVVINNENVFKVTGPSGNSIFFPRTNLYDVYKGDYWTSYISYYYDHCATMVELSRVARLYNVSVTNCTRCDKLTVRPVCPLR